MSIDITKELLAICKNINCSEFNIEKYTAANILQYPEEQIFCGECRIPCELVQ